MSELTLLIPANKESRSLPIFLRSASYNYKILVVLQSEDKETQIQFQNLKILKFWNKKIELWKCINRRYQ